MLLIQNHKFILLVLNRLNIFSFLDPEAEGSPSALEEISDEEAVSISVPSIPPASVSLRDYVDKSETLTKLVQLGG